ncbi:PLP-dependent aminotransferase family protein [Alkalimonas sp. MEB108]|uniref:PLP-dependent aminotransferase family protein n=1 Tax=Alkalimonas cellulosilytica TaxID=3058395 RepID=A0ABU7J218_9GAMM|nr:PLP-dependent aminotransferase family protein [Alkalimonas sp. MEB108]MEE2000300.1 PLP-dependent aminotransferase family protein [Alkalimonas sp. MEB108]
MQHLFVLEPDGSSNLQQQLIQKLIQTILNGYFGCGSKMPSSRKLAEQLGIARNTVVHAYQQLIDEGYLISKERSGIYVNEQLFELHASPDSANKPTTKGSSLNWSQRLPKLKLENSPPPYPDNWQHYPYPFINGQFDPSLFPVNQWRECSKLSLNVGEIKGWASDSGHQDDQLLTEEIRTKVLPRRGIQANSDEILVTLGSQQALYLLARLLLNHQTLLAMEEPGYQGMRQLAQLNFSPLHFVEVQEDGIDVEAIPPHADLVYVTPSHQMPTAVTMSMEKRQALLQRAEQDDFLILEDDYECETNFISQPHPAIKSLDSQGRVLYVSSFSKVLAPGLRLGFLVAPAEVIRKARQLRSLMLRHPPANNQRIMGLFLSLGYYDQTMRRLNQELAERWQQMREALNHYLSTAIVTSRTVGGSTCWIRGPEQLNSERFAAEAAKAGILIEPVSRFYGGKSKPMHYIRLGVSSIPSQKIRDGIEQLAKLIWRWQQDEQTEESTELCFGERLTGQALRDFVSRCEFIGRTVFGDPYRIRLHADGSIQGFEGYHDEKQDQGKWWLEGDHWYRQWQHWSYGEVLGFELYTDGNRINWVRQQKRVDSAFFMLHSSDDRE